MILRIHIHTYILSICKYVNELKDTQKKRKDNYYGR